MVANSFPPNHWDCFLHLLYLIIHCSHVHFVFKFNSCVRMPAFHKIDKVQHDDKGNRDIHISTKSNVSKYPYYRLRVPCLTGFLHFHCCVFTCTCIFLPHWKYVHDVLSFKKVYTLWGLSCVFTTCHKKLHGSLICSCYHVSSESIFVVVAGRGELLLVSFAWHDLWPWPPDDPATTTMTRLVAVTLHYSHILHKLG